MKYLELKFPLPKPEAPVEQREVTINVNGVAKLMMLPGSATCTDRIVLCENDNYLITVVDIDKYGNRSLPSDRLHGSVIEDLRPAKPEIVGRPEKRPLSEEEANKAKEELANEEDKRTAAANVKIAQENTRKEAERLEDIKRKDAEKLADLKRTEARAAQDARDAAKPHDDKKVK